MTPAGVEFPYEVRDPGRGAAGMSPLLPFTLLGANHVALKGLLDTGSAVNVLPYSVGTSLGALWADDHPLMALTGNLAAYEAKGLLVSAVVSSFPPVQLAFAWTRTDDVPVLLGQVNFFLEFDVCFYRTRGLFHVRPKVTV